MTNLATQAKTGVILYKVVVQKWEESERGWGTRPDGFTMHLTDNDRQTFIDEYWSKMPDKIPDEYSRPNGTPYEAHVEGATYDAIKKSKNGIWGDGNNYPDSGGTDGWMNLENLSLR